MRSRPVRILMSPSSVEDEDLRGYAQNLSYRGRGQPTQCRIYDFSTEQHGAPLEMRLQIVLSSACGTLKVIRARRQYPFFTKSDE